MEYGKKWFTFSVIIRDNNSSANLSRRWIYRSALPLYTEGSKESSCIEYTHL